MNNNIIAFFYVNQYKSFNNFEQIYLNIMNLSNINLLYKIFVNIKYFLIINKKYFKDYFTNLLNNDELLFLWYKNKLYSKGTLEQINNSLLLNLNKKYYLFNELMKFNYEKKIINTLIIFKYKLWLR